VGRGEPDPEPGCREEAAGAHEAYGTEAPGEGVAGEAAGRQGIALAVPDADDQAYIHEKYMGELVHGVFLPETRERLLAIVDRLKAAEHIQGLILGGTELPLILRDPEGRGIPFLDTTRLHVAEAVAQLLS